MTGNLSLYIHWPFCKSKCPYCDFNSHATESVDHGRWTQAYLSCLDYYESEINHGRLGSVFFGGGTPSLMKPRAVERILEKAFRLWPSAADIEVTLEANPTSAETQKFRDLKSAGVNRLSLGAQSFRTEALRFLGREHNACQAKAAIETASGIFDRYSFDLIYARPGQRLDNWLEELEEALELAGDHLSLYQLTIEKGTDFHRHGVDALADDPAADMFLATRELLKSKNLPAYEVSNHAERGSESRHNLRYWTGGDYIGIGPGAHGRLTVNGVRTALIDHRDPARWLETAYSRGVGLHRRSPISTNDWMVEDIMMGLRLDWGLNRELFRNRHGLDIETILDPDELTRLREIGLVEMNADSLAATERGIVKLNGILSRLISDLLVQ